MNISVKWVWYRDLLQVLLHKELTVRYKGSFLGFLWSILNPLAMAIVYYLVFGVYMRFNVPNYILVLLSAMFPWQCFSNCVGESPFTFLANPTLVKKVAFPRQAIPLVMNLQHMVHFFISIPIYIVFMLFYKVYPSLIWFIGIPLLSIIMLMTIYGLCLLFGTLNLFLKDIGNLVIIGLNIMFFASPIFYVLDIVPKQYLWCFKANPVAPIMICWRSLLYNNTINMEFLPFAAGYGILFLTVGWVVFRKLQYKFAEVM